MFYVRHRQRTTASKATPVCTRPLPAAPDSSHHRQSSARGTYEGAAYTIHSGPAASYPQARTPAAAPVSNATYPSPPAAGAKTDDAAKRRLAAEPVRDDTASESAPLAPPPPGGGHPRLGPLAAAAPHADAANGSPPVPPGVWAWV